MADNFLERRMADYREGRIKPSAQASRATASASLKSLPAVMILGGDTSLGAKTINYFRSLGWRVAFTDPDLSRGRQTAQSSGAQHHPIDPTDTSALAQSIKLIIERWGHLDMAINRTGQAISLPEEAGNLILLT